MRVDGCMNGFMNASLNGWNDLHELGQKEFGDPVSTSKKE